VATNGVSFLQQYALNVSPFVARQHRLRSCSPRRFRATLAKRGEPLSYPCFHLYAKATYDTLRAIERRGHVPLACGSIQEACLAIVTRAKRPRREGPQGIPVALSSLVTPLTPGVWTHVVCAGPLPVPFPTLLLAHTPTDWGHGGTRKSRTSRSDQTLLVSPAAIAGV
jgi:hypothetical protein